MHTQPNVYGIDPAHMDGHRPLLRGQRHMAVAGHYLASQAALQILEAGGNAIDAGVAGGIVLGVVQSPAFQMSQANAPETYENEKK